MKTFVLIVTFAAAGVTDGVRTERIASFDDLSELCVRWTSDVAASALGMRAAEPASARKHGPLGQVASAMPLSLLCFALGPGVGSLRFQSFAIGLGSRNHPLFLPLLWGLW